MAKENYTHMAKKNYTYGERDLCVYHHDTYHHQQKKKRPKKRPTKKSPMCLPPWHASPAKRDEQKNSKNTARQKETLFAGKRSLKRKGQKKPVHTAKETYYRGKRDLL